MAIRSTGGFGLLRYEPGNPEFPTLPDGVIVPHVLTIGRSAGLAARAPVRTRRVLGAAPANDEQRFAGWQTQTTWVNPSVVDFGVIPSPVQRTVSLYNARSTSVEVTALTLPSGVILIDSLPVTLTPYAGFTFTLEAGASGDNTFDEFVEFTTSEGAIPVRMIGRRVFTLENIPQTPMIETLMWKTDLIRSKDGTEKAYSLMYAPLAQVDYKIKFTNDIQRMKFKNGFIAGESALIVAGQKWYEMRRLQNVVQAIDTSIGVASPELNASWKIGGPISIVSEDGTTVASAQLDSTEFAPDPDYLLNTLVVRFDGANGSQAATDLSPLQRAITFVGGQTIDTSQSVFGGSSLLLSPTAGSAETVLAAYDPAMEFTDQDFTVQFWMRPTATDISAQTIPIARWTGSISVRSWRVQLTTTGINFTINSGGTLAFPFPCGSPREIQADTWHYVEFNRVGTTLRCFIDGVQLGTNASMSQTLESGAADLRFSGYQEGGVFNKFNGHIDDVRITVGLGRNVADYTPPTEPHPAEPETYLALNLSSEIGAAFDAGAYAMPVGLGYVSQFPTYGTYALNLEEANYQLTFNQEGDFSNLDTTYFPTLTDQQSPASTLPILEFRNEIGQGGGRKRSQVQRFEDSLSSGLANRIAFNVYPFADNVSEFEITLNNEADVWAWRTFFHYLRGSYGEFYVPTFTNDLPGVTTAASNIFDVDDTNLSLLFGNPPDPRRNAIRLLYPNGNVYYRFITQVIDNGAQEEITVSSAVEAGSPFISYLQRARILGDTVTFEHHRTNDVSLRFRFRTILI